MSKPDGHYQQRDYFVRDGGAATRAAGFHTKLAEFLGWKLPMVQRFNGIECPLYLEAIFPLFVVEQKHGWSGIQANLPRFFQIRDVAKRAVEFVLQLDAAKVEEARYALETRQADVQKRWDALLAATNAIASSANGRVLALLKAPTSIWPPTVAPTVEFFEDGSWVQSVDLEVALYDKIAALTDAPMRSVQADEPELTARLQQARERLLSLEGAVGDLYDLAEKEKINRVTALARVEALREDLQRNQDALKLRNFGSVANLGVSKHECPTCRRVLSDTLLEPSSTEEFMSIEDNISFIQDQINMFGAVAENSSAVTGRYETETAATREEGSRLRAEIRSIRDALTSANNAVSPESVRRRLETEARRRVVEEVAQRCTENFEGFAELSGEWQAVSAAIDELPKDGHSSLDKAKLRRLEELLKDSLKEFRFTSLNPDTLQVSTETYRPSREGFDLGFNVSASDNVRLIWAYLESLLEMAVQFGMNHPGVLIFDEPRQQSTKLESFQTLLRRAAKSLARGQQVIFATSEALSTIEQLRGVLPLHMVQFEGQLIRRIG